MNINHIGLRNTMKGLRFRCICLILILIASCSKKDTPQQYPDPINLETGAFSDLSANEVTLTANIQSLNNEEILDHGFIWYMDDEPERTISLGNLVQAGTMSHDLRVNTEFEQNITYYYFFYIRTKTSFYKGTVKSFVLNNIHFNALPLIHSYGKDTVALTGNFEGITDGYRIKASGAFESFTIPYELSSDKKTLTFVVGANPLTQAESELDVSLVKKNENPNRFQRQIVKIRYHAKLDPPAKRVYNLFEFVEFMSTNIGPLHDNDRRLTILINDLKLPYTRHVQLFRFAELSGTTFRIGYTNSNETVYFPDPIELELPIDMTVNVTAPVAHPHGQVAFTATHFAHYFFETYTITVDGARAYSARSSWSDEMMVSPPQIEEGEYKLEITNRFYTVTAPQKIRIQKLYWHTLDKDNGFFGEKVTAYGNFIEGVGYIVFNQDDRQIAYQTAKNGMLDIVINEQFENINTLKIGYSRGAQGYVIAAYQSPFVSKGSTMDGFYPKRGTTGDILTITGKGIAFAGEFLLGNQPLTPIRVPNKHDIVTFSIPTIQGKGNMRINYKMGQTWHQIPELFELY